MKNQRILIGAITGIIIVMMVGEIAARRRRARDAKYLSLTPKSRLIGPADSPLQ